MTRIAFITLVFIALVLAADDPGALVEKALKAAAHHDDKKAIALLRKADDDWQTSSPNAPQHGEALEYLALLMKSQAAEAAQASGPQPYATDVESWRTEAAPFVKRALEICEANSNINPEDLALALELQADVLGRKEDGAPFWERATKIRAQRIAAAYSTAPVPGAPDRIGRDVSAPSILAKREPDYTASARLMRYSGSVLLSVIVNEQGIPTHIRLVRGLGYGLDEKAAEAISTWRFRPAMKNGSPVAVQANIQVNFRLL